VPAFVVIYTTYTLLTTSTVFFTFDVQTTITATETLTFTFEAVDFATSTVSTTFTTLVSETTTIGAPTTITITSYDTEYTTFIPTTTVSSALAVAYGQIGASPAASCGFDGLDSAGNVLYSNGNWNDFNDAWEDCAEQCYSRFPLGAFANFDADLGCGSFSIYEYNGGANYDCAVYYPPSFVNGYANPRSFQDYSSTIDCSAGNIPGNIWVYEG
jgi:hypothetical protein